MKKILLALFFILLISCSEQRTFYEYNDVVITRVDKNHKIYFYFGKYETGKPDTYIEVIYKGGGNGGMAGALIFNIDKTVEACSFGGYFKEIGKGPNLYIKIHNNTTAASNWADTVFTTGYKNVVYISDTFNYEREINNKGISQVKVTYPK